MPVTGGSNATLWRLFLAVFNFEQTQIESQSIVKENTFEYSTRPLDQTGLDGRAPWASARSEGNTKASVGENAGGHDRLKPFGLESPSAREGR